MSTVPSVPAHKQTDPAQAPGQIVNRQAAGHDGVVRTIGDYVARVNASENPTPAPVWHPRRGH